MGESWKREIHGWVEEDFGDLVHVNPFDIDMICPECNADILNGEECDCWSWDYQDD